MSMIAAMDYTDDAHTVHVRLTRNPNFSIDVPDDHQASHCWNNCQNASCCFLRLRIMRDTLDMGGFMHFLPSQVPPT